MFFSCNDLKEHPNGQSVRPIKPVPVRWVTNLFDGKKLFSTVKLTQTLHLFRQDASEFNANVLNGSVAEVRRIAVEEQVFENGRRYVYDSSDTLQITNGIVLYRNYVLKPLRSKKFRFGQAQYLIFKSSLSTLESVDGGMQNIYYSNKTGIILIKAANIHSGTVCYGDSSQSLNLQRQILADTTFTKLE